MAPSAIRKATSIRMLFPLGGPGWPYELTSFRVRPVERTILRGVARGPIELRRGMSVLET